MNEPEQQPLPTETEPVEPEEPERLDMSGELLELRSLFKSRGYRVIRSQGEEEVWQAPGNGHKVALVSDRNGRIRCEIRDPMNGWVLTTISPAWVKDVEPRLP